MDADDLTDVDRTKAIIDDKSYRLFRLASGVRVLVIHDPAAAAAAVAEDVANNDEISDDDSQSASEDEGSDSADDDDTGSTGSASKSAARKAYVALVVGAGSFDDPMEVQGLAHFCEHLTFMGSKKFPIEKELDQFVSQHGGYTNAFTELEYTCYQVELCPAGLPGSLDRLAAFMLAPLLSESSVMREVSAIESEFNQALSSDTSRLAQLQSGTLPNRDHPLARFSWGNMDSIIRHPKAAGIDPLTELRNWFSAHYCDFTRWHLVVRCNATALPSEWYTAPAPSAAAAAASTRGVRGQSSVLAGDAAVTAYAALNALERVVRSSFRDADKPRSGRSKAPSVHATAPLPVAGSKGKRGRASTSATTGAAAAGAADAVARQERVMSTQEALQLLLIEQQAVESGGHKGVSELLDRARALRASDTSCMPEARRSNAVYTPAAAAAARSRIVAPGTVAHASACPTFAFTNPFALPHGSGGDDSDHGVFAYFSAPRELGSHIIALSWSLPPLLDYYWSRPEEILGFTLGHEAEGSLLAALRLKGWATELFAGVERAAGSSSNGCCSILTVSVTATAAGVREWREVVTTVFSYIVHVLCGGVNVGASFPSYAAALSPSAPSSSSSGAAASAQHMAATSSSVGAPGVPPVRFPLHCPGGLSTIGATSSSPGPVVPFDVLGALYAAMSSGLGRVYPELAAMSAVRFHATDADAEEEGALESVTKLACSMMSGCADDHVLDATGLLGPWTPAATTVLLAHLTVAHLRVDVQSVTAVDSGLVPLSSGGTDTTAGAGGGTVGGAAAVTDTSPNAAASMPSAVLSKAAAAVAPSLLSQAEEASMTRGVEQYFQTPYVQVCVDADTTARWVRPPTEPVLHLPLPNPYLPSNLDVKPLTPAMHPLPQEVIVAGSAPSASGTMTSSGSSSSSGGGGGGSGRTTRNARIGAAARGKGGSGENGVIDDSAAASTAAAAAPVVSIAGGFTPGGGALPVELVTEIKYVDDSTTSASPTAASAAAIGGGPMLASRLWFKQDDHFRLPKTNVRVALYCPVTWMPAGALSGDALAPPDSGAASSSSSLSAAEAAADRDAYGHLPAVRALLELWSRMCADDLSNTLYYAELAEVEVSISVSRNGLLISLAGLTSSMPQLLAIIMKRICGEIQRRGDIPPATSQLQFRASQLQRLREALVRDYQNAHMDVGAAASFARESLVLEAHLPSEVATSPNAVLWALNQADDTSVEHVLRFGAVPSASSGLISSQDDVLAFGAVVSPCSHDATTSAAAASAAAALATTSSSSPTIFGGHPWLWASKFRGLAGLSSSSRPRSEMSGVVTAAAAPPIPQQSLRTDDDAYNAPVIIDMLVHGNEHADTALALFHIVQTAVAAAVFSATAPGSTQETTTSSTTVATIRTLAVPPAVINAMYPRGDVCFVPAGASKRGGSSSGDGSEGTTASSSAHAQCSDHRLADVVIECDSLSQRETNNAVSLFVPLSLDDDDADDDAHEHGNDFNLSTSSGGGGGAAETSSSKLKLPLRRVTAVVLQSLCSEPAFNDLRTKQQLGYSVSLQFSCSGQAVSPRLVRVPALLSALPRSITMRPLDEYVHEHAASSSSLAAGARAAAASSSLAAAAAGAAPDTVQTSTTSVMQAGRVLGLLLSIESASHSPADVATAMVHWLCGFRPKLLQLCGMDGPAPDADGSSSSMFARHVAAFIEEKLAPDVHMAEESDRIWREISTHRYSFFRTAREVVALRQLQPQAVVSLFDASVGALGARVAEWNGEGNINTAATAASTGLSAGAAVLVKVRGRGATASSASTT